MVTVPQIISKLQNKIFTPYGKSVTLKHENNHSYNDRGDVTTENWTTSTISLVPYDFTSGRLEFENFSRLVSGDFYAAVPSAVVVSPRDQVVIDSVSYEVKEVIDHLLPENAVIIIRLTKIL